MTLKVTRDFMAGDFKNDPDKMNAAIVKWWIDSFPESPVQFSMPHLGNMANTARIKALKYGITSQPEVCAFANLLWLYGPTPEVVPDIANILNAKLTAAEKIEQLYVDVSDAAWDTAAAKRDENAWFAEVTDT